MIIECLFLSLLMINHFYMSKTLCVIWNITLKSWLILWLLLLLLLLKLLFLIVIVWFKQCIFIVFFIQAIILKIDLIFRVIIQFVSLLLRWGLLLSLKNAPIPVFINRGLYFFLKESWFLTYLRQKTCISLLLRRLFFLFKFMGVIII